MTQDDQAMLDAMGASRYAIGEEMFIEQTQQRLQGLRTGRVQDEDLALPAMTVGLETVDRYVARHYGIAPEDLKAHGRRAGVAKALAVELACRLTGESGRAVGQHDGGISASAVGNIRRKVRDGRMDIGRQLTALQSKIRKDAQKHNV